MTPPEERPLGPRFADALAYAAYLHRGQRRKSSAADEAPSPPYVSHLLAVTALVLEHGGDEDEAIAAMLHDGPEDQGGRPVLEEIRNRFGERVASLVEALSDTLEQPKPPWIERKRAYVEHLRDDEADPSALLVSLADKLHNLRSILRDHRRIGPAVWERFTADRDQTLAYYRSLRDAFREKAPARARPLVAELEEALAELEGRIVEES